MILGKAGPFHGRRRRARRHQRTKIETHYFAATTMISTL
jgi:hypothetical protein